MREVSRFLGGAASVRFDFVSLPLSSGPVEAGQGRAFEKEKSNRLREEVRASLLEQGVAADRIVTSTSHTRTRDGLAVVVIGSDRALGVDLESSQRSFHPKVEARILSPDEEHWGLKGLGAWVAKEAVYKAYSENAGTVLSQYKIVSWERELGCGEMQISELNLNGRFRFQIIQLDHWLLAIACRSALLGGETR